ncbi:MAG: hypothetical protein AAGE96_21410 [Cyanobacteria bacterium P01_G01_bin.19]
MHQQHYAFTNANSFNSIKMTELLEQAIAYSKNSSDRERDVRSLELV